MPTTQTADLTTILLRIKEDPSILIKAVALGHADDIMPELIDEVNHRRKATRRHAALNARDTFSRGDRVVLSGLRPSTGLNGVTVTYDQLVQTRAWVSIPTDAPSKYAGQRIKIPLTCMTKAD